MISPYERTKSYIRSGLYIAVTSVILLYMKSCDNKKVTSISTQELTKNEQTAIIVDPSGKITKITKAPHSGAGGKASNLSNTSAPNIVTDFTGARGIRFSIDTNGNVTATSRTYGFIAEPGIGIYAASGHTRILGDVQVGFYRRHGLNLGFGISIDGSKTIRPSVAYSYLLPWKYLSNSSFILGIDLDKSILIGVRTKL